MLLTCDRSMTPGVVTCRRSAPKRQEAGHRGTNEAAFVVVFAEHSKLRAGVALRSCPVQIDCDQLIEFKYFAIYHVVSTICQNYHGQPEARSTRTTRRRLSEQQSYTTTTTTGNDVKTWI